MIKIKKKKNKKKKAIDSGNKDQGGVSKNSCV